MYNIKGISDNLIFTSKGDVYAYYRMHGYNNSFITLVQQKQISERVEELIRQSGASYFHLLQIATEDDFREVQNLAKKEIRGNRKEFLGDLIDMQTDFLVNDYGEKEIKYRHFVGFKIDLSTDEFYIKEYLLDMWGDFKEFLSSVRYHFMQDYYKLHERELGRYESMERIIYEKIGRKFEFERLTPSDYGYLIEHIHGLSGVAYSDYCYHLPLRKEGEHIIYQKYDVLKLTHTRVKEKGRHLEMHRNEGVSLVAYFAISTFLETLQFPESEILYNQQLSLGFPVDTSLSVEVIENRSAIKIADNKSAEMKDMIRHALKHNAEPDDDVLDAEVEANNLKSELKKQRSDMYKLNYLLRVSASTEQELRKRCIELKDYYDSSKIRLVRPMGNMLDLHEEFLPASGRKVNDYVQLVDSVALSCLGFGSGTELGDGHGIYVGESVLNAKPVYIRPWLAAQGMLDDVITNSMSSTISGATGWGKSMFANLLLYYIALYGGKIIIFDPKSERGNWKDIFPEVAEDINIINLTSSNEDRGKLDPYVILKDKDASDSLVRDILCYLTNISPDNGKYFPTLAKAIRRVTNRSKRGMLHVIAELKNIGTEIAIEIAEHIESFADYGFAKLLFSDGEETEGFNIDKPLNIFQVSELQLPDEDTLVEEYKPVEKLSIACMCAIGTLGLGFLGSDTDVFKVLGLDEAWALLGTTLGSSLKNKAVRMGRSMNSGIYFITQGVDDVEGKNAKNNIGMKFAFHSDNEDEIKQTLSYFKLDAEDIGLQKVISSLKSGEVLFQDIRGRIGIIRVDLVFQELFDAFDTRPVRKEGENGV